MELTPALLARPFVVQTDAMADPGFALPAGTVTFLLTDVEGSTRLWEASPTETGPAVARHYELLDEAIARHGGVRPVEQGEGDSVVAAFARARDAVAAAVEAQLALSSELNELPVRMALHTGEAQLRDEGNYVGRTIIRCARLRSCGHGGQILVSETTAALLADALPAGTVLVDLGAARLRDLGRRERVWQVHHAGLRDQFPPLRSLDAAPHNLPTPLTSFIGREQELAALDRLVAEHRLVTIAGSGGAGKTRLAVEAAAAAVDRHDGGTWWVELAPIAGEAEVAAAVAAAIGLGAVPGADPLALVIRQHRSGAPVLLVLDNAEHLLDTVASACRRLLEGCPALRLLVTSREPLGVPGEVIWRVPSMSTPRVGAPDTTDQLESYDAVRLFLERARAARPNLVVDDALAAHVAEICARLDGIPLAIELAAARVRSMTVERIASGLHDAFRLLTGGSRTVLARQQTLLASIAWSVDALDAPARAVFARLAVFHAPFTLDAAEAVAADGEVAQTVDVLDIVARLVDKSLVQFHEETGRYSLLETLRQFGLDRLRERGELVATRQRHASWYVRWAEEVRAGVHGLGFRTIAATIPDVSAALDWCYEADTEGAYRICAGLAVVRPAMGDAGLARQCDWLLAQTERTALWAAATAGTLWAARLASRSDMDAVWSEVAERLDPADAWSRRTLALAVTNIVGGRVDGLPALAAEALADGDDAMFVSAAGVLLVVAVRRGMLDDMAPLLDQLHLLLERTGQPLTPDVAGSAFMATQELLVLQGRLAELRTIEPSGRDAPWFWVLPIAAQRAYLGFVTQDRHLMELAERALVNDAPAPFAMLHGYVRGARAAFERRWHDAAPDVLAGANGAGVNGIMQGLLVPFVTMSLLGAGRIDDARAHLDRWRAAVSDLGHTPLQVAVLHQCAAMFDLVVGDEATALGHAHALLDVSHERGYALFRVDALEVIADVLAGRGQGVTAARALGAAWAERDRMGYAGRWRPDPDAAIAGHERLASEHPAAFAEGRVLPVDDAVALVRRSRGERGRPTRGWPSLTPTERRVVDLVADGLANGEIAARLLMSVPTVKSHLTHVFGKLDLTNRTELAAEAVRRRTGDG